MKQVGPWGDAGDFVVALAPIALVLYLTLKSNAPPPSRSLPTCAAFAWFLRLVYFDSTPNELNAGVAAGALGALNVVAIIFGAVLLFKTMELTGCLQFMIRLMKHYTGGHPVAEAMLIGWCFVNIVEGAAGFGTPVALASPILIELGAEPFAAIAATLTLDALGTHFGAVGPHHLPNRVASHATRPPYMAGRHSDMARVRQARPRRAPGALY